MILVYALGSFMDWDEIAFYASLVPFLAFLLLLRSPESPVHLVSIGEEAKAERSLMQINETGFDTLSQVKKISLSLEEQKSRSVDKMDYLKNILQTFPHHPAPQYCPAVQRCNNSTRLRR